MTLNQKELEKPYEKLWTSEFIFVCLYKLN